jgi:DNA-binding transcriptional MerR regulator/methylmalonyl-CoA mutase cobalamin-binding subunit
MAGRREDGNGAWLSIGALSRATGVAVETLRTWESRYGFPVPERKPSGHRVYPIAAVPRLRRIAQALTLGHRAGQVVGASEDALDRLLETSAPTPPASAPTTAGLPPVEDLAAQLRLVKAYDAERLSRAFLADWARLGPVEFLETVAAPLVRAIGEAWARGDLDIRHEHFLSERLGDLLRSLRMPLDERATGPLVAFATLPGEGHGLGLQMAALVLATAGCRGLYLGTGVPIPQITALVRDLGARAVGVSVSAATRGASTATALRRLRESLPRRVIVLTGGEGAPGPRPGIESLGSLRDLDAWGRRIAAGLPVAGVGESPA